MFLMSEVPLYETSMATYQDPHRGYSGYWDLKMSHGVASHRRREASGSRHAISSRTITEYVAICEPR